MNTLLGLALYALTATKSVVSDYVLGSSDVRAERTFSMANRYPVPSVSDVFRDNILLTLAYMNGRVADKTKIDWSEVEKTQTYSFTLQPGEAFAFHESVLPEYQGKVSQTMRAHFNWADGFKSDGWLTGDGVCHLASLIYWAAKDAGLTALAPTNHNFAAIAEVPKEYGVSIFSGSPQQNLYITNTFDTPVQFAFAYDGTSLSVKVIN